MHASPALKPNLSREISLDTLSDMRLRALIEKSCPLSFQDNATYSKVCTALSQAAREGMPSSSSHEQFALYSGRLQRKEGLFIIPTPWGGVVGEKYEGQDVDKFLVVNAGKFLAYEKHEMKWERLEVTEGVGILLVKAPDSPSVSVHVLAPGAVYEFLPEVEHAIIAGSDLLVHEISKEPKGMDNDLIFLFTPVN